MAGLTVLITCNGVVQSTYDDGTPADMFSGKLPVLHEIFTHMENKDLLPKELKLGNVKFYITSDPLCKNTLEVTKSYLQHILQYVKFDKLEQVPLKQKEDVDVNKIIEEANNLNNEIEEASNLTNLNEHTGLL